MLTPPFIAPRRIDDSAAALAQVRTVYDGAIAHLRDGIEQFVAGQDLLQRVRAYYPYVRVRVDTQGRADSRLSYGFVAGLQRNDADARTCLMPLPRAISSVDRKPPRARNWHERQAIPCTLRYRGARATMLAERRR
jgi:hypothetical protein